MLEKLKEALVHKTKEKQKNIEILQTKLQEFQMKFSAYDFYSIMQERKAIEEELTIIKSSMLKRIFQRKKLEHLENTYHEISNYCLEDLLHIWEEGKELFPEISNSLKNSFSYSDEITKIKKANSIEDLNFTQKQALEEIQNYSNYEAKTVIQKVFSDVLLEKPNSKEDLIKIMRTLYQTNSSAFVLEMNRITLEELEKECKTIGIVIEKEKISFLKSFIKKEEFSFSIDKVEITDDLDAYYWSEVKKGMKHFKKYPNSNLLISELMTLSVLISICKKNRKKKEEIL